MLQSALSDRDALANRAVRTVLRFRGVANIPSWPWGLARPDLIDLSAQQLYEIKPVHLEALGRAELSYYLGVLNSWDPGWIEGFSYRPTLRLPIGVDIVTVLPPRNGVILYSRAHTPELVAIGVVASLSAAKLLEGQVALHTMTAAYGF